MATRVKTRYGFVIAGAGLSGGTAARVLAEAGQHVLVVEKRRHVGGNCHTEQMSGVWVHIHGPHIFHTASREIWDFVTRFAAFHPFRLRVKSRVGDRLFSLPINLTTLHHLWGVTTPEEAERALAQRRVPCAKPSNMEEWALSQVGAELYELFFRGYTTKQWGTTPDRLPASILRRLPIRLTHDDSYFPDHDLYQGVPRDGYTALTAALLDHPKIELRLGVDFLEEKAQLSALARHVVYTGPLDALYGHRLGRLGYRSLRFEHQVTQGDVQGCAIVNYPSLDVPWTRQTEHKHFVPTSGPSTVVTREFPQPFTPDVIPYYPLSDETNLTLAQRYAEMACEDGFTLMGRMATYRYLDMDMAIGQALRLARRLAS